MTAPLRETRTDHNGRQLPQSIYALTKPNGTIASYKTRWREEDADGILHNASKSFSIRKLGSADAALAAATAYRDHARQTVATQGIAGRTDPSANITVNALFQQWCLKRGATLSKRYAEDTVKRWDREIATRPIAKMRLGRVSRNPSAITRFHDELDAAALSAANRTQILKTLRSTLRWGRRRYPNALTTELSGLFELPSQQTHRLAYTADAYGLERLIEAASLRPTRNPLIPIRDAAFIAAMGFTIAARPSEWLYSATWADLHQNSVELQRPTETTNTDQQPIGLKTGARAALLLPNARDRILAYRAALEAAWGPQPDTALIFQALGQHGPLWSTTNKKKPTPTAWTHNHYKRWTARVWRRIRDAAATTPEAPPGLAKMRFYDCRHTAISMALHSTLIMGPHGMNLHNLAGWAGHDVQTLQRYYAHIIARYQSSAPIDLTVECAAARSRVEKHPSTPKPSTHT